ncbi:TonB-dependent receptor plug domain-containing protein [Marinobacterium sp. YM272]|uniref:TonB-dependent receptor plug domain-containing protein n=1 Tax=Marinobacterium sp. YM272 TaxID=3421654 RepID=UPI003D7F927D
MKHRLLLPLVTTLVSPVLHADETGYLVDIPRVTAVSGSSQWLNDAAASVTIITRDLIDASGARTIPELLRLVPGFQSYRVDAHKWGVSYHGVADDLPNRLEFQVDGCSVYLPLLSTVEWISLGITPDDVERIEVVRGSNAATQGSNAFSGSVNIITRSALNESGFSSTTRVGSRGERLQTVRASGLAGDGHYRLSSGYREDRGSKRFGDGYHDSFINTQLLLPLNLSDTLNLRAGLGRGSVASSTDYGPETGRYHGDRDHRAFHWAADFEHIYSPTGTLNLSAWQQAVNLETDSARDDVVLRFFGDLVSADDLADFRAANSGLRPVAEHGRNRVSDLSLRITETWQDLTLSGSLGWRELTEKSDVLLVEGPESEERWRLQSALEWHPARHWTLNSGVLFESSDIEDALSLRQSVNYKPDRRSVIRLGWSRSERLPSLLESYQNSTFYLPSLDGYLVDYRQYQPLAPELNQTWELGYHRHWKKTDFVDLRLFREKVSNAIHGASYRLSAAEQADGPVLNSVASSRANGAQWTASGIEGQFRLQLSPALYTLASYSHVDISSEKGLLRGTNPLAPRHTASLLLNWSASENLDISLMHYYLSDIQWLQNERTYTDSQSLTNLRIAYTWPLVDYKLETALLIEGLGAPTWPEFSQDNAYDRGAFFQLKLAYR